MEPASPRRQQGRGASLSEHAGKGEQHPGAALRELRVSRGMTLQELSQRSGVSVSMISKVETGGGDPSLSTLRGLAAALNVPLSLFFRDQTPVGRTAVRINHKQTFEFEGVETTLIVPPQQSRTRLLRLRAAPGAHRHKTEFWTTTSLNIELEYEYGLVIAGQMELEISGETYHLNEGDSIAFPTAQPRSWRNPGPGELQAIWCVTHIDPADH